MTPAEPAATTADALVARARAALDAAIADGRWSPERDGALEAAFERAASAALALRQPGERSVVLRRLARLVPRGLRPVLGRAVRAVDRRIAARPRAS